MILNRLAHIDLPAEQLFQVSPQVFERSEICETAEILRHINKQVDVPQFARW